MNIGFKTGPNNWDEGRRIVKEDGAKMCEVWFRIDKEKEYENMLAWLKKEHVAIGLHHWGLIDGTFKTNMASSDKNIRDKTIQQIKDTIDIGSEIECVYVNAHCGAATTEKISFETFKQGLAGTPFATHELTEQLFLQTGEELNNYAKKRGVLLTIETLPGRESASIGNSRQPAYSAGNTPLASIIIYSEKGGLIANDITHTAGQIALKTQNPAELWTELFSFTKRIQTATKLLHVNTVIPPFDGTDSHNGLLQEDFSAGAFPNLEQIKMLLSLFSDRDDIYVVPEPHEKMQENYRVLVKLVG